MAKPNFLKELGKREILTPHLNRVFATDTATLKQPSFDLAMHLDKPQDDAFHPSSHALLCDRLLYAAFDPKVPDSRSRDHVFGKTMACGHLWHALIQHMVVEELEFAGWSDVEARYGIFRPEEGSTLTEPWRGHTGPQKCLWWATGSVDLANVNVPGHDKPYLVDIKTMGRDYALERPRDDTWHKYVMQLQLYLDWTGLDTAIMLCVEKAYPHGLKEILIHRDPELVNLVYDKWDRVALHIANDTIPPHTCDSHGQCPASQIYIEDEHYEYEGAGH